MAAGAPAPDPSLNFPPGYEPEAVWKPKALGGTWGAMNRETAAPRSEGAVPVGKHPLQLYSLGTPNGQKVTVLLEELADVAGVEYDAWTVNILQGEQFTSGFTAVNPNQKIPALVDHSTPTPTRLFESGAILLYLAEKYQRFLPVDPTLRAETFSWLFWQMGSAPYIGGGFFHFYRYAPVKIEYAIDRFAMETKRLLDVLDRHLSDGREWIVGSEYTIADIAIAPWFARINGPPAGEFLGGAEYKHVNAWTERFKARPAVKRGLRVNGFEADSLKERHEPGDFAAAEAALEAKKAEEAATAAAAGEEKKD